MSYCWHRNRTVKWATPKKETSSSRWIARASSIKRFTSTRIVYAFWWFSVLQVQSTICTFDRTPGLNRTFLGSCLVTYSTTVSPEAAFMTLLDSGRGVKWSTTFEADVGIYVVNITATSKDYSESTNYTVDILSQHCSTLTPPVHDAYRSYTVNDDED